MRTKFCVEAAALLPLSGFVDVPTWHPGDERTPQMETVTLWREEYEGKVYGLDVPPHHHYVSGGAVVHNSVKGGEADTVHLIPDLSVAAKEEEESSTEGADAIRRTIYVGLTRARDRVVIHAPHRDHLAAIV